MKQDPLSSAADELNAAIASLETKMVARFKMPHALNIYDDDNNSQRLLEFDPREGGLFLTINSVRQRLSAMSLKVRLQTTDHLPNFWDACEAYESLRIDDIKRAAFRLQKFAEEK